MSDTVIVAALSLVGSLGGALIAVLPAIIANGKKTSKEIEELRNEIKENRELDDKRWREQDDRWTEQARVRILTFDDDLCDHSRNYPSVGSWKQILKDCDTYETYIKTHTDFSNGIGEDAIKNIRTQHRYCKNNELFGKPKV